MPIYHAAGAARKKKQQLVGDLQLLGDLCRELEACYPYLTVHLTVYKDEEAEAAYYDRAFRYGTNIEFPN